MQPTETNGGHPPFRIDDTIYLDFQQAEPGEAVPAWRHDTGQFCDELIRLREISLQSGHILANIRKHHPDIGQYLALLDRKIDILSRIAGTLGLGGKVRPNHQVSLGSEGMHFDSAQPLEAGTPLRLKIVLFPSHLCLHLQSRVTGCDKTGEGYRIEVRFEQLGETEHEALIRHLTEKQSAALRRQRGL